MLLHLDMIQRRHDYVLPPAWQNSSAGTFTRQGLGRDEMYLCAKLGVGEFGVLVVTFLSQEP